MPFIPHTETDTRRMLDVIGVQSIDDLFDEIPATIQTPEMLGLPSGISEMELGRLMAQRSASDSVELSFVGAGAYHHYIPAAVWDLVSRGEFMTAYTPYQAEASQGTLQLIYEYQSMMAQLTAMDVSNASVYDGASAVAEAVLMAVRTNRKVKSRRVLVAGNLNPFYRMATESIVRNQGIELTTVNWSMDTGCLEAQDIGDAIAPYSALVISQPNFFGGLERVDDLTDLAHGQGALVIAVVNPTSLAILKAPGDWGETGADIAVGDGQPLGIPLSSGGPYFGFMCSKKGIVRQMPGRIVGRTLDLDGKEGFTLTLQAREQHIRRAKATSNICTNQGLLVTAATIYLSLMGSAGLRRIAGSCHRNCLWLRHRLGELKGVRNLFDGPVFHEFVIDLNKPVDVVLGRLAERGIVAGFPLLKYHPELSNGLLINVTETSTEQDMAYFVEQLDQALNV